EKESKPVIVLYFGDFDPSGEDMVRSLRERLGELYSYPEIIKCALTLDDIRRYHLPTDFTKTRAIDRSYSSASCTSCSRSAATFSHALAISSKVTLSSGRVVVRAAKARQCFACCWYSSILRIVHSAIPGNSED